MNRTCARDGCDQQVTRKAKEGPRQTEGHRFCSQPCYTAYRRGTPPTRVCQQCGKTFGPARSERASQFVAREPRFCSQRCNGASRRGPVETGRRCARVACGAVLAPHPGETPAAFARRKLCDRTCAGAHRTETAAARPVPARPRRRPRPPRPTAAPRPTRRATPKPKPPPRPKPALSVFGDVAPSAPWRPAGFSARPGE